MTSKRNIIKNQICEITVSAEIDYYKLKDKVVYALQRQVYPKLGVICNKHAKYNTNYTINSVEINLGRVDLVEIISVLVNQVPKEFEAALLSSLKNLPEDKIIHSNSAVKVRFQFQEFDTSLQAVKYFLNTGVLPWWSKDNKKSLTSMLMELIDTNLNGTKQLLSSLNKNSWYRLITQQNDYQLLAFIKIFSPGLGQNINRLHQDLYKLIQCTKIASVMSNDKLRLHYWSFILTFTITKSNEKNLVTFINELISYMIFTADVNNYKKFIEHVREQAIILNKQDLISHFAVILWSKEVTNNHQTLFQLFGEIIKVLKSFSISSLNDKEKLSYNKVLKIFKKFTINPNILVRNFNLLLKTLSSVIELLQETTNNNSFNKLKASSQKLITLGKQVQQGSFYHTSPLSVLKSNPYLINDTYYIENSGLILYWVYLKDLFARLGLLKQTHNEFVSNKACMRATMLLNLFTNERTRNIVEYELILNKILCGMRISDPLPSAIAPKSFEKQELKFLTSTLMIQWQAIGKITLKDFSQVFVKRTGSIKLQDNQWILRITKNPQDILISKLPWSINVVTLPWMHNSIIVEW